jgi:hypothetical protein
MALSMATFLNACDRTDAQLQAVGADAGVRAAERTLPDFPHDCRSHSRAGVKQGDRLDVALLKFDAALSRQNGRTTRCGEWYDGLRRGLQARSPDGVQ